MSVIELEMYQFLQNVLDGNANVPEVLFDKFAERCKHGLKQKMTEEGKPFTLRMSNIGKDTRQLMLEKTYGRGKPSPDFLLKMLDGTLQECLLLFIVEAAGIEILNTDTKVSLDVAGFSLDGTYDVKFKVGNKIYDFKTASAYSYENKFVSWETLAAKDDFGYFGQGFGYAKADNSKFGGWIVKNKNTGEFKVVDIPDYIHDELSEKYLQEIQNKVQYVNNPDSVIPECKGAVEETYYKAKSGNIVLADSCRFCNHKDKCHPGIQYLPSKVGKGNGFKWYIKVKE